MSVPSDAGKRRKLMILDPLGGEKMANMPAASRGRRRSVADGISGEGSEHMMAVGWSLAAAIRCSSAARNSADCM